MRVEGVHGCAVHEGRWVHGCVVVCSACGEVGAWLCGCAVRAICGL
jgi:hypothetical protein